MKAGHPQRVFFAALLLPASLAIWGCNDSLTPQDGFADPKTAVEKTDVTAAGTTTSDADNMSSATGAPSLPGTNVLGVVFRREITSATRTATVVETDNTATVTVVEERTGILHVRGNDEAGEAVEVTRPFTDHGERHVLCEKTPRGLWRVTSASIMDRVPVGVASPVTIEYVEFALADGRVLHIDDPAQLLARGDWPRLLAGQEVHVTVKLAAPGGLVFLHDRFGFTLHRTFPLMADAEDATVFRGVFRVPAPDADGLSSARTLFGVRFLTVDAFDSATLSLDPAAAYNSRQWVVPFLYRPLTLAQQ